MAVRIRLKRMGRRHRPFFRVCAMDARTPRDGRVIEELGYYDPMVKEVDARAILNGERIDYWLGVGAQPTPKVKVLIKKYGAAGTHLEQQQAALERLKQKRVAPPPKVLAPVETPADETPADEAAADEGAVAEAAAEASETTEATDATEATEVAAADASQEAAAEGQPEGEAEGAEASAAAATEAETEQESEQETEGKDEAE